MLLAAMKKAGQGHSNWAGRGPPLGAGVEVAVEGSSNSTCVGVGPCPDDPPAYPGVAMDQVEHFRRRRQGAQHEEESSGWEKASSWKERPEQQSLAGALESLRIGREGEAVGRDQQEPCTAAGFPLLGQVASVVASGPHRIRKVPSRGAAARSPEIQLCVDDPSGTPEAVQDGAEEKTTVTCMQLKLTSLGGAGSGRFSVPNAYSASAEIPSLTPSPSTSSSTSSSRGGVSADMRAFPETPTFDCPPQDFICSPGPRPCPGWAPLHGEQPMLAPGPREGLQARKASRCLRKHVSDMVAMERRSLVPECPTTAHSGLMGLPSSQSIDAASPPTIARRRTTRHSGTVCWQSSDSPEAPATTEALAGFIVPGAPVLACIGANAHRGPRAGASSGPGGLLGFLGAMGAAMSSQSTKDAGAAAHGAKFGTVGLHSAPFHCQDGVSREPAICSAEQGAHGTAVKKESASSSGEEEELLLANWEEVEQLCQDMEFKRQRIQGLEISLVPGRTVQCSDFEPKKQFSSGEPGKPQAALCDSALAHGKEVVVYSLIT